MREQHMKESVGMDRVGTVGKNCNMVDVIKVICAVMVVMGHIEPFGKDVPETFAYLNFGFQKYLARIAVPFFFVASGYFLFRKSSTENFDVRHSAKYIKRILRLYLTWTILYLPLIIRGFFHDEKGLKHAISMFVRYFFFTGSYAQLWYLPALMTAVLIVTILLHRRIAVWRILAIGGFFYFIGLFAQSWFGFIRPLEHHLPGIWNFLKLVEQVIITTRDGLFDGFLFVAIGMYFAFYNVKMRSDKALVGFLLSMTALFAEVFALKSFHFIKEYDMYLFLVPAVWYLFCFAKNTELPDHPIYGVLRKISSLIFYLHLWVDAVVVKFLLRIGETYVNSGLQFVLTLIGTIMVSMGVIWLSENRKFAWMKRLYV
ncbi:Surface polysaccharide O-acyltransferase, integral membrane enzyme [[Clostridium] aminophilum]|uniref:Surface polysaccharide O-acyltransferase, integral membrane enzyme n=1 Tax=[Clostridium] aminophilum TaxID=1526 RepID=A0A1I0CA83_9FIRM|nr:acyltransferase [[Clostridium] aminophilum]SET16158.1 Surface polysaccharide O-acyltransferase, integral membrane enzyme [[Clostridium] aminophilum]